MSASAPPALAQSRPRYRRDRRCRRAPREGNGDRESLTISLAHGERALFLTDGMPEAPDRTGKPLGDEAFAAILPPLSASEPGEGLDGLFARVQNARQEMREDDWSALLLEHRGKS